jgi:hypothetical protein
MKFGYVAVHAALTLLLTLPLIVTAENVEPDEESTRTLDQVQAHTESGPAWSSVKVHSIADRLSINGRHYQLGAIDIPANWGMLEPIEILSRLAPVATDSPRAIFRAGSWDVLSNLTLRGVETFQVRRSPTSGQIEALRVFEPLGSATTRHSGGVQFGQTLSAELMSSIGIDPVYSVQSGEANQASEAIVGEVQSPWSNFRQQLNRTLTGLGWVQEFETANQAQRSGLMSFMHRSGQQILVSGRPASNRSMHDATSVYIQLIRSSH